MASTQRTVAGAAVGLAALCALASPFISKWEGTVYVGYRDIGGVVSYCTGGTGPEAILGKHYSPAQCDVQRSQAIARHAELIRPCVPATTPTESQVAFISLAYNIGVKAFCGSTVAKRLKAGDLAGACAAMGSWVLVNGKRIQGLANRRADEMKLCRQGVR